MLNDILDLYSMKELVLLSYLMVINIVSFALMGIDKNRARKNKWRIQEKTYFILSFFGGAIGAVLGMIVFRHKTQHKSFYVGIPMLYIINKIIIQVIMVKIK